MTVTVLRRRRGRQRQRTRQAQEPPEQLRVVLDALAQVGTWSLAAWQTRGDEPEDPDVDAAFAALVAAVKSKVACLRDAYPVLGWTDLANDLNGLDDEARALEALIRLQRYHGPVVRVRAAGTSTVRDGKVATARELALGLEALTAHCAASYYYDPQNFQTEDAILAGLVQGVRDLARACSLTTIADLLGRLTYEPGQAPQARDRLTISVLPECREAFRRWCAGERIRSGGEVAVRLSATASSTDDGDIVVADGKYRVGRDYKWVEQVRPRRHKKRWNTLPLNTQLALRVLCEECRGEESAKAKTAILSSINTLRERVGKKKLMIDQAISHLFRVTEGTRRKELPFFKTLVEQKRGGLYWIDVKE